MKPSVDSLAQSSSPDQRPLQLAVEVIVQTRHYFVTLFPD